MKKPYVKPFVYAESYALMEHVALNCVVNDDFQGAKHRNANDCAYVDDNLALFVNDSKGCDTGLFSFAGLEPSVENLPAIGVECYNSFLITGNLFAS